jgi:hypothetical protein
MAGLPLFKGYDGTAVHKAKVIHNERARHRRSCPDRNTGRPTNGEEGLGGDGDGNGDEPLIKPDHRIGSALQTSSSGWLDKERQ